jgi:hypothetical protein
MCKHVSARLRVRYAPRRVWFVDGLPRTDTGKVRRAALADHVGFDPSSLGDDETDVSPASPLELALGALWAGALRVQKVERNANFFMLGGDSLRGASLLDQVQAVFGVALPVQALRGCGLRGGDGAAHRARAWARRRPTRQRRSRAIRPASRSRCRTQARAWFLHRLDPTSDAYRSHACGVDGQVDVDALRRCDRDGRATAGVLRTRYVVTQGEPRQVVAATSDIALEVVDLGGPDEARLEAAVAERMSRPFDLAAGPPVRFVLFSLGPRRHALLRVWHHITNDGLSSGIFQQDLSEAYAAVRAGRAPAWTPLPVDYADFAAWQRREFGGHALDAAVDTWTRKLPTCRRSRCLSIASIRLCRASAAASCRVSPSPATDAMKLIARDQGATPFIAFLATYAALLARLSGVDIPIGTPVAGRETGARTADRLSRTRW